MFSAAKTTNATTAKGRPATEAQYITPKIRDLRWCSPLDKSFSVFHASRWRSRRETQIVTSRIPYDAHRRGWATCSLGSRTWATAAVPTSAAPAKVACCLRASLRSWELSREASASAASSSRDARDTSVSLSCNSSETVVDTQPVSYTVANPCYGEFGELVTLTGHETIVYHLTTKDNETVAVISQYTFQASGVGEITGANYQVNNTSHASITVHTGNTGTFPTTTTSSARGRYPTSVCTD